MAAASRAPCARLGPAPPERGHVASGPPPPHPRVGSDGSPAALPYPRQGTAYAVRQGQAQQQTPPSKPPEGLRAVFRRWTTSRTPCRHSRLTGALRRRERRPRTLTSSSWRAHGFDLPPIYVNRTPPPGRASRPRRGASGVCKPGDLPGFPRRESGPSERSEGATEAERACHQKRAAQI